MSYVSPKDSLFRQTYIKKHWKTKTNRQLAKDLGIDENTVSGWGEKLDLSEKRDKELTGKKIGQCRVLRYIGSSEYGGKKYKCKCDCGNNVNLTTQQLQELKEPSCHKCRKYRLKDWSGHKIGKCLIIKRDIRKKSKRNAFWISQCECDELPRH